MQNCYMKYFGVLRITLLQQQRTDLEYCVNTQYQLALFELLLILLVALDVSFHVGGCNSSFPSLLSRIY